MPVRIHFSKAMAERFLNCLTRGTAIEDVRTTDDILTLAGACLCIARSQGPMRLSEAEWGGPSLEHRLAIPAESYMSLEQQRAAPDLFQRESNAAVEFQAHLTTLVREGRYDEFFDPEFQAVVWVEDGEKKIHPVRGLRKRSDRSP